MNKRANARLISAAPEMFLVLMAIADLKGWNDEPPVSATGIQVMAALRKAGGEG